MLKNMQHTCSDGIVRRIVGHYKMLYWCHKCGDCSAPEGVEEWLHVWDGRDTRFYCPTCMTRHGMAKKHGPLVFCESCRWMVETLVPWRKNGKIQGCVCLTCKSLREGWASKDNRERLMNQNICAHCGKKVEIKHSEAMKVEGEGWYCTAVCAERDLRMGGKEARKGA